jgi:hypothetical protein
MEDIVWIGNDGQDNSGASTLGLEFNKILGIKTLFKGTEFSKGEISIYRDLKDLKILLDELKPKIILLYPGSTKKMDKVKDFYELIFSYQLNTKIILIDCSRYGYLLGRNSEKILEEFDNIFKWKFDYIWHITDSGKEIWNKYTNNYKVIDINLHTLTDKEISNRENSVGYIARYEAFKGVVKFIRSLEKTDYSNVEHPYVYLGNDHEVKALESKGIVSGVIYVVNQFAKSIKDKTPKEPYSMKYSVSESIEKGKINVYPRYNFHEKEEVFRKVGVAICPTLARETRKEIKNKVSLFSNVTIEKDKDDKYIEKNKSVWLEAMEYVNYEFIDYGIPVMFSRDYCLAYDSTMIEEFPELIYDNLEDCFTYCQNNYEDLLKVAPKQKEWLRNKLLDINKKVKEELEYILKGED